MDPQLLRMFMHVAGLMMAAVVADVLPFSTTTNLVAACGVWLADGAISEAIYRRLADADRHDNGRGGGSP